MCSSDLKSAGFRPYAAPQCLLIVAQMIPVGDFAVEICGISSGYLVSTKLIQPGQQLVYAGPFPAFFRAKTSSVSKIVHSSAPQRLSNT